MPDQPVEREGPEPYRPPRLEMRVSRLEDDMSDVATSIARMETTTKRLNGCIGRLEAGFTRLEALFTATLPYLATKKDVARLSTKAERWGVLAVLITAMSLSQCSAELSDSTAALPDRSESLYG
jgi:hypothetical protein